MQPRVAIAIAADYNGRWAQRVIDDAKTAASGVRTASGTMGKSIDAANGNVANLAAQFNDIGVTLASGQSPLLIAAQQGTQVAQILGPLGVAGAAKALGSAFLTLLSPVNLITIATIGLGAAAVQWLMSINQQSPAAEDRLKAHTEWLRAILVGYKDVEDAAIDAADAAMKLPQAAIASDLAKRLEVQRGQIEKQFKSIIALLQDFEGYAGYAEAFGVPDDVAESLRTTRDMLRDVTSDGRLSADELYRLTTVLTELKNSTTDKNIQDIAEAGLAIAKNFRVANAELDGTLAALLKLYALPSEYFDAMGSLGKLGQEPPTEREQAATQRDQGLAGANDTITRTAVLKAYNDALARIDTREAEEEALKRSKEFEALSERQAESYAAVTDSLRAQLEVLGMSTIEQEKFEQVRAAGVDANSTEAQAIRESVQALNDRKDALEVINAMKSPADIAEEEIERLGELYAKGELDAEQYAWAVNRALSNVSGGFGAMASKVGDILGSLSSIMQSSGEEQFGIAKGLSVAMAVLKGYEAVTSAYAAGAAIGGPVVGALYAGAAAAATAAQIANVMSTTSKSSGTKGAAAGGNVPTAATAPAQRSGITIDLKGLSPNDLFSGEQMAGILNGIKDYLGEQGQELAINYKGA